MAKKQLEVVALQESVHSLAGALMLLRDIFQGQGAAFNSEPYKKFTAIVQGVLDKTSQTQ